MTKERVVSLPMKGESVNVVVEKDAPVVLDFPLQQVVPQIDGNTLILNCPEGRCIILHGPGDNPDEGTVVLSDGRTVSLKELAQVLEEQNSIEPGAGGDGSQDVTLVAQADTEAPAANTNSANSDLQTENSAQDVARSIFSSGSGEYSDHSGSLVKSISHFGMLGRDDWQSSEEIWHAQYESGLGGAGGLAPVRNIEFSLVDGTAYLEAHTVLESDPFGIVIHMQLSQASDSPLPVVLLIGGTAHVNEDYAPPSQWRLILADGREVAGSIHALANGQVSIDVPLGTVATGFRVPLINDDLTSPDRTFTYKVQSSGGYVVSGGATGVVTIVDDTHAQEHGWTPPAPGDPDYSNPGHVGPSGPIARLVFLEDNTDDIRVDGKGNPLTAMQVMENSGQDLRYRFELIDAKTGGPFVPKEDIPVSIKVSGLNGLSITDDHSYNFSNFNNLNGVENYRYNPSTGLLTFTLKAGVDYSNGIVFTGKPIADLISEPGTPRETVKIEIISAEGNETIRGGALTTEIVDVPTVSVSATAATIFESAGHPSLPSSTTFNFDLSSKVPLQGTVVNLHWENLGDLKNSDYEVWINGVKQLGGLPSSITFGRNETHYAITVKAVDDQLSELNLEKLAVTIEPESGAGNAPGQNYHVSGAASHVEVTFIDDTSAAYGQGGKYLDGPIVQVVVLDEHGDIIRGADGRPVAAYDLAEQAGRVTYQLALLDRHTFDRYDPQETITVNFKVEAVGTATVRFDGAVCQPGDDVSLDLNNFVNKGGGEYTASFSGGGANAIDLIVSPQGDGDPESGEGFKITMLGTSGNESSLGGNLATTIVDVPVVSISVDKAYYSESGNEGAGKGALFTLSLEEAIGTDVTVKVQLGVAGDSATRGADFYGTGTHYNPATGVLEVTIPAGDITKTFLVPIKDDALSEGNEFFTVKLLPENGVAAQATDHYQITSTVANQQAQTVIVDDTQAWPAAAGAAPAGHGVFDGPEVRLVITNALGVPLANSAAVQVMENGGPIYYKLMLVDKGTNNPYSGTDHQDITVNINVSGNAGLALSGVGHDIDFARGADIPGANWVYDPVAGTLTVVIPSGQLGASFTATPVPDADIEAVSNGAGYDQEKVTLSIDTVSGNEATVDAAHKTVSTEIIDVPTVSIAADAGYYSESHPGGLMGFTVSLSSPTMTPTTVYLSWGGAATPGTDYGTHPASVIIPAGQTSYYFTVPITDDALSENNESVVVSVTPQGGTADDTDDYHVSAGNGSATTIIVDDTQAWPGAAGAAPAWHGAGGAALEGPYVKLVLTDGSGTVLPQTTASVFENDGQAHYRLVLVNANGTPYTGQRETITVILDASVANGAALSGAGKDFDFGNGASYDSGTGKVTVTIPAGQNYADFTGTPVADKTVEPGSPRENVGLTISGVSGNESSIDNAHKSASIDIIDVPTVNVSADATSIFESAGHPTLPNTVTYTFTLTSAPGRAVTVNLDWSSGTDAAHSASSNDYTVQGGGSLPGSLTFGPGETSKTITVIAVDDRRTENDEILRVTIKPNTSAGTDQDSDPYHIGTNSTAAVTIIDDASLGQSPANTYLDGPTVMLVYCDSSGNILLDGVTHKPIIVGSVPENQSAQVYYKAALFETNTDHSIKTNPDGSYKEWTAEEDVTVTVAVRGNESGMWFGGAGKDFGFNAGGNVSWTPDGDNKGGALSIVVTSGSKGTVFTGNTVPDSSAEGQESFSMSVTKAVGNETQIQSGNSLSTNIIDIPTLTITADKANWSESGPTPGTQNEMTFTIQLSSPFAQATNVNLAWTGTATPGVDYGNASYVGGNTVVSIPAGVTSYVVRVPIIDDALTENNEGVTVTLKPYNGVTDQPADPYHVGSSGFSVGTTIVDDTRPWPGAADPTQSWHGASGAPLEGPKVELILTNSSGTPLSNSAAQSIMENGGKIYYTLKLVNADGTDYTGQREAITVTLQATGKEGLSLATGAGQDFTFSGVGSFNPATGAMSVTIPAGSSKVTFSGTATSDFAVEGAGRGGGAAQESVTLDITAVSGNESAIYTPKSGTEVTIIDVPTASITSSAAYYSESGDPSDPGKPSEMVFTVHLSSPVPYDTTIGLAWDDTVGAGKATYGSDYTGRPGSVTILAGQTEITFRVPIVDDAKTELNEIVSVSLKPVNGVADLVADSYHVSSTAGAVTVTIVDDSKPWPTTPDAGTPPAWHNAHSPFEDPSSPTHGPVDGPLVAITALDPYQFPVGGDDRNVQVLEEGVGNNEGHITYRVQLVSRADGASGVNAAENVTVSLKIDPQYTTVDGNGVPYDAKYFAKYGNDVSAGDDFYLNMTKLLADYPNSSASYDPATKILTMTIPAGTSYLDFDINGSAIASRKPDVRNTDLTER